MTNQFYLLILVVSSPFIVCVIVFLTALAASRGWHRGKLEHFQNIWGMTKEEPNNEK